MLSCDSLLPGLELIICLLPTASSYELCLVVVCGGCFYFWILFCFRFVCVCVVFPPILLVFPKFIMIKETMKVRHLFSSLEVQPALGLFFKTSITWECL